MYLNEKKTKKKTIALVTLNYSKPDRKQQFI